MNLLDLAQELNLSPKRVASTSGGEYKSKCPKCQEGRDRFCIWPNQGKSGRYWCRVCEAKGDAIQFCRDFLGMSFHQACKKVNISVQFTATLHRSMQGVFVPNSVPSISPSWQQVAKVFLSSAHKRLMDTSVGIDQLVERGITIETIKQFCLGWNPENLIMQRETWGLPTELKESGSPKRLWLPKGIVIPAFSASEPIKIKIRRSDWSKEDTYPKYVEVSGSRRSPSIYGDTSKPVIIVESELDAILIQQEASHLVCCVALGGMSKKPDIEMHKWLQQVSLILLSLDFDDAGKSRNSFWMKHYPNLRPWPAPHSKSPGDFLKGFPIKLSGWIKAGLSA